MDVLQPGDGVMAAGGAGLDRYGDEPLPPPPPPPPKGDGRGGSRYGGGGGCLEPPFLKEKIHEVQECNELKGKTKIMFSKFSRLC